MKRCLNRWPGLVLAALLLNPALAQGDDAAETSVAARAPAVPTINFGRGHTDKVYSIRLSALNEDCDEPQDFLFVANGLDFIKIRGSDWLQQLARGEKRAVEAVIDLRGIAPGDYNGDFQIFCESCGWLQFGNSCRINTRIFRSQFQVLERQDPHPEQDYSDVPVISEQTRQLRQQRNDCVRALGEMRFNYALLQKLAEKAWLDHEAAQAAGDSEAAAAYMAEAQKFQAEADTALSGANFTAENCRQLVLQAHESVFKAPADSAQ